MTTKRIARRLADRLARRLGYVRADTTISGTVEFRLGEPTFVDLTLPSVVGPVRRVRGSVHSELSAILVADNPALRDFLKT